MAGVACEVRDAHASKTYNVDYTWGLGIHFDNICVGAREALRRFFLYFILFLRHEEAYFMKDHSDSKNKYSEDDIIKMLEFLLDNIFVIFTGNIFQQKVGIPIGTSYSPF